MSSILDLELPSGVNLPGDVLRAINERFLRVAEALKASSSTTGNPPAIAGLPASSQATGPVYALQGTHKQRAAARAELLSPGSQYFETDRLSTYIVRSIGGSQTWTFESGTYAADFADRPGDLALYDAGFVFLANDWGIAWRWDGKAWRYVAGVMSAPSGDQPSLSAGDRGFLFFANDWLVLSRWTGTEWTDLTAGVSSDTASFAAPRHYEAELEDLRRRISSIPRPRYYEAEIAAITAPVGITTQTDVLASRAVGTVYQNTGTKPLFVAVAFTMAAGAGCVITSDASNPPVGIVGQASNTTAFNMNQTITFIVLPGNYYKVVVTSLAGWFEWQ